MLLDRLRALERTGRSIRVAVIGAGQIGQGVIRQLARTLGMRMVGA